MPSKRQPSKQRRAAQNRNTRAQRAARAEHAGELAATTPATNGARATKPSAAGKAGETAPRSGGLLSGLFGGGGGGGGPLSNLFGGGGGKRAGDEPDDADDGETGGSEDHDTEGGEAQDLPQPATTRSGRPQPQALAEPGQGLVATKPDGTRVPGAMATFLAVVLAALAAALLLVTPIIEVDDEGNTLPDATEGFKGLYLEARGLDDTGEISNPVETETKTLVDVEGPEMALVFVLPLLMVAFSYWSHRKTGLSRPLTIGMLAVAVVVLFMQTFGQFYIPALIALAVGSFQARKAELPARTAARITRDQRDHDEDDDVIDVDSVEEVDDDLDDDYEDDEDEDLDEDFELDEEDEDEDEDLEDELDEDDEDEDEDAKG